jgi:hypothetical protein
MYTSNGHNLSFCHAESFAIAQDKLHAVKRSISEILRFAQNDIQNAVYHRAKYSALLGLWEESYDI